VVRGWSGLEVAIAAIRDSCERYAAAYGGADGAAPAISR
jgi:hypothetical protein